MGGQRPGARGLAAPSTPCMQCMQSQPCTCSGVATTQHTTGRPLHVPAGAITSGSMVVPSTCTACRCPPALAWTPTPAPFPCMHAGVLLVPHGQDRRGERAAHIGGGGHTNRSWHYMPSDVNGRICFKRLHACKPRHAWAPAVARGRRGPTPREGERRGGHVGTVCVFVCGGGGISPLAMVANSNARNVRPGLASCCQGVASAPRDGRGRPRNCAAAAPLPATEDAHISTRTRAHARARVRTRRPHAPARCPPPLPAGRRRWQPRRRPWPTPPWSRRRRPPCCSWRRSCSTAAAPRATAYAHTTGSSSSTRWVAGRGGGGCSVNLSAVLADARVGGVGGGESREQGGRWTQPLWAGSGVGRTARHGWGGAARQGTTSGVLPTHPVSVSGQRRLALPRVR